MSPTAPAAVAALEPVLRERIRDRGAIPFADFMELCLYHPEHGYYTRGLGGGGGRDYLTSSGVHEAFGRLVARQAIEMWRLLSEPPRFRFVEIGPGEGIFAADFLAAAGGEPAFARALEYLLVERSPALRERQQRRLGAPSGSSSVAWRSLEELEADARERETAGCLFANEVLDAFPVHRVEGSPEGVREIHVELDGDRFREVPGPLSPGIAAYLEENAIAPQPGQIVDVAPGAARFAARAAAFLDRGFGIFVDYGEAAADLFHPLRRRGTLRAFHRHRLTHEVLDRPGEQDLTAHVDFTAVRRAAAGAGWAIAGQVSQAHFLLALGALEDYEAQDPARREALKDLVLPDRMGGAFQVLILARGGAPSALRGLSAPWRDRPFPGAQA